MATQPSTFRYDINGLRAYAVMLVVLFHFNASGFSAGFIGVDIFFVISGFLMTKIILKGIHSNAFSFLQFILARAIRILPALLVLILVLGIIGYLLLIPEDYITFSKNAISSILFISNILYFKDSGSYFSTESHENILLHTWSLSIEWQFYFFLPIILLIILKIFKNLNYLTATIILGFILSFLVSIYLTPQNQSFSFYLLPTRAWEMLIGSIVFLVTQKSSKAYIKYSKLFEFIGFVLLFTSLLLFDSNTLWPGYSALLPSIGTAFIIFANNNSKITNNIICQQLGNASYSIYLWHWPIVYFINYLAFNSLLISFTGIVTSILIGFVSYKVVETPSRYKLNQYSPLLQSAILVSCIIVVITQLLYIYTNKGIPNRADNNYTKSIQPLAFPFPENGWCFYNIDNNPQLTIGNDGLKCRIGSNAPTAKNILLFGDSYAGHNIPFWDLIGKAENLSINAITTNWCYPSLSTGFTGPASSRAYNQCLINRKFVANHYKDYDMVILAGRWSSVYLQSNDVKDLHDLISTLQTNNINTIVMDAPPFYGYNVANQYKRFLWFNKTSLLEPLPNSDINTEQANISLQNSTKKFKHLLFLTRTDLYPPTNSMSMPYSYDGGHLNIYGSVSSAQYFMKSEKFNHFKYFIHKKQ